MICENALVVYKNKPALVKEKTNDKYSITLKDGSQIKVREKDIEPVHSGPVKNFTEINVIIPSEESLKEAWELLSDEGGTLSLEDLASFVFNEYTPSSAYSAYLLLQDGLYFSGDVNQIILKGRDEIALGEARRSEKQKETDERAQFLNRLKACLKNPAENKMLSDDARFIQDAQALAFGKSSKSRTMKELNLGETPEDAHSMLLKTGFWTRDVNPHPQRCGLSLSGASAVPSQPPSEERTDLCRLKAFAIDSPWSCDPDDAVSVEITETGKILYVHVADPASSVKPGSPAEREARDRGATLYLPETTVRMLADDFIPEYALGIKEKSNALTFKMTLDRDSNIINTEIFPSIVKVRRMTYEEADREMSSSCGDFEALCALDDLALVNFRRRTAMGAVNIDLPEVHITVENGKPEITPVVHHRSSAIVRECMIIAGEGAGTWAAGKGLAFPYICQEAEIPPDLDKNEKSSGFAESIQLRRCMRPRVLSTKPGRHQGLGLDIYTQVTSPLRRYTDLLAHMQIRLFLRNESVLSADELMTFLSAGEAAAIACAHAERSSKNHWITVFLEDKKDSLWDAVALENKGYRWSVLIPHLAFETSVSLQKNISPNDNVKLVLKSVNIPRTEAVFVQA